MEFNEQIKCLRQQQNLTQDDLAKQLNVSRQSVSGWERGLYYPDIIVLLKLAEVLNVTVDFLLKGDQIMMTKLNQQLKRGKYFNLVFCIVVGLVICIGGWLLKQREFFNYGHSYLAYAYLLIGSLDAICISYSWLVYFTKRKIDGAVLFSLTLTLALIVFLFL